MRAAGNDLAVPGEHLLRLPDSGFDHILETLR